MAVLCWMAVMLGLLLSAETSLAADVDQNELAGIVTEILNRYRPSYNDSRNKPKKPMFSLAVSIPYNSDSEMYDISQVTDTREQVWQSILNKCEVYTSKRMVAATVLRWPNVLDQCPEGRVQWSDLTECGQTWADVKADVKKQCPKKVKTGRADHAEYRILQNFATLVSNHDKNDLLLFYVFASPCDQRCTNESNPYNILNSIKKIQQWNNYAVVFSKVFKPHGNDSIHEQDLRGALERLGQSVGLINIFRCNGDVVQCTSCSSGTQVTPYCYSDKAQPTATNVAEGVSSSQSGLDSNNRNDGSNTGVSISPLQAGPSYDNGNNLNVEEDVSSSLSGIDNDNGNDGSKTGKSLSPSQTGPNYDNGHSDFETGGNSLSGGNKKEDRHRRGKGKGISKREGGKGKGISKRKGGKGRGVSKRKGGKGKGVSKREGGKGKGISKRKGGKGRGVSKRKGGKGKGVSKRKGGKGKGISKRKGGKGNGISKRKGGKGKGISKRKGGKGRGVSKRKGGKGKGMSRRKGGKGKGVSKRKGGKGRGVSKRKGGKGKGMSRRKGGKGKGVSKRKGGKGRGMSRRKGGKGKGVSKRKGGKGRGMSRRKGGKGRGMSRQGRKRKGGGGRGWGR